LSGLRIGGSSLANLEVAMVDTGTGPPYSVERVKSDWEHLIDGTLAQPLPDVHVAASENLSNLIEKGAELERN
jgi:hypothetical protein